VARIAEPTVGADAVHLAPVCGGQDAAGVLSVTLSVAVTVPMEMSPTVSVAKLIVDFPPAGNGRSRHRSCRPDVDVAIVGLDILQADGSRR